ncbi:hypothetical protein [Mesorhizobium sp. M7A.F.Ca.MR.362.00.0.0]|uniref:hypothetical protein n=1 Tax=Mesorhizobium sp. M7A.F.Ca.MR.362.00.0.0 TaxID=2496779 RepID=UPI000FD48D6F|nr:hypothetical protein [Mesorhizobium sp. M7A.F.Ca.MR.362.00.0.0]RUU75711.1 hypothetical protein EOC06_29530 [Mesorhizobium sp. M7A.F.Ca.MR.362.00.0.0]RWN95462.1 MAG: hypothetical protein EOS05_11755 [Mesorhizobium sp.]
MLLSKNLAPLRAAANTKIDDGAGEVRKRFITAVPGQEMVYQQKRLEAEQLMANPDIATAEIPHIAAEAALNNITSYDQAVVVLTMSEQWTTVSAQIETMRLAAKAAVARAANPAAIEQAATIDWSAFHA